MSNNGKQFKLDGARAAPEVGDAGEFFSELSDHTCSVLMSHGFSRADALVIVNDLILHLAKTFHGEPVYIAKRPMVLATQMAAWADLQYMSYKDVDLKYGWSRGYSLKLARSLREKKQRREQLVMSFNKN